MGNSFFDGASFTVHREDILDKSLVLDGNYFLAKNFVSDTYCFIQTFDTLVEAMHVYIIESKDDWYDKFWLFDEEKLLLFGNLFENTIGNKNDILYNKNNNKKDLIDKDKLEEYYV